MRRVTAAFLCLVVSATLCVLLALAYLGPHSVTMAVNTNNRDHTTWLHKKDVENVLPTRTSISVSPSVFARPPTPSTSPPLTVALPDSAVPPTGPSLPSWLYEDVENVLPTRTNIFATGPQLELYTLSLSYMDQMSWAATRMKSLQCWATTWKSLYEHVGIVEPLVTSGAHLGVPVDVGQPPLKFSDLFDIDEWDSEGERKGIKFPKLVSWSNFLNYAPRNVVAVQIVYDNDIRCPENEFTEPTCGSARLNATLSQVFKPHNFRIMHQVCINFKSLGELSVEAFNRRIFDRVPKRTPITLIFDEWRGPGGGWKNSNKAYIKIEGGVCTPNDKLPRYVKELARLVLTPSLKIQERAKEYISQYLNDTLGYVSVLIRWEKLLLTKFYGLHFWPSTGAKCVKKISELIKPMYLQYGTVFLTTDIGRFGSSTFNLFNATRDSIANITRYTGALLREFHNKSISLADYDQRFEDFAGTNSPAVISQLQKSIAANARCLVLVGWGTFHENALKVYKRTFRRNHSTEGKEKEKEKEKPCFKIIRSC